MRRGVKGYKKFDKVSLHLRNDPFFWEICEVAGGRCPRTQSDIIRELLEVMV
jgi:hypothetical protein